MIPIVKLECIGYDREFANDLSLKSINAPHNSNDTLEASGSISSRPQAGSDDIQHHPKSSFEGMSTSVLASTSDVRRSGRQRALTSKVLGADYFAGSDSSDEYIASEEES